MTSVDCPAGCGRVLKPAELLCRTCWTKTPKRLRDKVDDAQHFGGPESYRDAVESVVRHHRALRPMPV